MNIDLMFGSQVGNSNSEEFPFYTSKNPEGRTSGVFAVQSKGRMWQFAFDMRPAFFLPDCYLLTYLSVFAGFTRKRLISSAII